MPAPPSDERLSFDDAQILSLESDAIKGHTGKVLVLAPGEAGGALTAARLRERVSERIGALPRLRQRVEVPRRGLPFWVDAPDVDLAWHVAETGSGPVDEDRFRRLAGEILAERLDHSRPLWRLDLVPLDDGRTGMVGRIHHAMADGVTAIRTAAGLLFDAGGGAPKAPASRLRHQAQPTARAPHKSLPASPSASRWSALAAAVRLPGALLRELRPGRDTVLDRHIGSGREVAWCVVPLQRLKEIGHRAGEGVTVNDVVLAAVAGGLRRWLGDDEQSRPRLASIKAQVPVCLHLRDADPAIGNRDSFLNVDLPLAEPEPLERLRAINAETTERKLDHDADTLYAFFHALSRFGPLYRGVTRVVSGPREFALSVSNVPGPRERASILGHRVSEFCSFAEPADRHALRVAVISLGGDLAFGLCSDPEAIGGLDGLAEALEESVAELEAAT
jgi:diacylglycerol O-acyltransferase / wax synthase